MFGLEERKWEMIKHHQQGDYVDIEKLINAFGVEVKKEDLGQYISGKIIKKDGAYIIYANSFHPVTRQRFTMAHEFAHFLLHKDFIGDGIEDDALYRSKKFPSKFEREANKLAAEILMPWQLIEKAQNEGIKIIALIAAKLKVSKHALAIRFGLPAESVEYK